MFLYPFLKTIMCIKYTTDKFLLYFGMQNPYDG